ncbi:MAG: DUF456 domain-containing protein [Elusimicrobia bacterium]|nr:DUF456 domain-containing protein [Elusimicrobiota bacterium]
MKTPRLALFALLALALAPFAQAADMPGWKVTDESFRSWPKVFFTAGGKSLTLNCRWAECNPEKNKTVSNLYVMKDVGVEKIQVTIMDRVPLGRWDPRRRFGSEENRQGYTRVPKVIEAARRKYTTELSHFKLDNTGKELVVVQGDKKFPATTDIRWQYVDATGNVIAVAPPTKEADDLLKPENGGRGGNGGRGDRGGRGGSGAPSGKWWCDPKTGEKYNAARGRRGSTLLASKDAPCKKTGSGTAPGPVVTNPDTDADASLALVEGTETRWLTKAQAAAYAEARGAAKDAAAKKAADDKYRALVEAQTRPGAVADYKAARSLPAKDAPAKIKAALDPLEMWGGKDVKAIVAPFQEKAEPATAKLLEIQLSKADWELLKKKPEDQLKYTQSRLGANGSSGDGTAFDAKYLDPVALRLGAEAARKAVGSTEGTPPGGVVTNPNDGKLIPLLTDDEKKLLTPSELAVYEGMYKSAPTPKEKDKSLQNESKRLRDLIASEGRGKSPAYAKPGDRAAFDKLPEWQRKKFCDELLAETANPGADTRGAEFGGGGSTDPTAQLKDTHARSATNTGTTTAPASTGPEWAVDACKPYRSPATVNNPGGKPPLGGVVPTPGNGVDVENKEKEKSKWLTQDLLTSAAKGAMVGLLVGSLFGPVGLIAGPILGGALFYGLTKITS